jgi:hypothetical protein
MRRFSVLSTALIVVGCAEAERAYVREPSPEIAAAKTDCSPYRWSYGLQEYGILRVTAESALRDSGLTLYSTMANFKDIKERSEAEMRARAKADEVIKKLDDLEREADVGKARAGNCFGEGDYGKKVAESYAWTKETIADFRKAVADGLDGMLARNNAIEAERSNFERWRAKNREGLVRHTGGTKLEIVQITTHDLFGWSAPTTVIVVEVTNTTTSKILKPRNQRVWGYEFGSGVGGRLPVGASLSDSFGNDYKLTSINPGLLGSEAGGIRPGQTVTFELGFGDVPLQNARSVRLTIAPDTFGQESGTAFVLPLDAFYGAAASR